MSAPRAQLFQLPGNMAGNAVTVIAGRAKITVRTRTQPFHVSMALAKLPVTQP
jgi:hypothetical protein